MFKILIEQSNIYENTHAVYAFCVMFCVYMFCAVAEIFRPLPVFRYLVKLGENADRKNYYFLSVLQS